MQYGILLWPHANCRYQQAVSSLALGELSLLLACAGLDGACRTQTLAGAQFLTFETQAELGKRQIETIGRHSSLYLLFGIDGGQMTPIIGRADAYLDHDLTGILKYKGKTNESFTRLLINMALMSSAYKHAFDQKLTVFDPMCGRMTTLFEALNRGYDAYGADADGREIGEGLKFFRKYLEYHRLKHSFEQSSLTLPDKKSAQVRRVAFANDAQAFRAGDKRTLAVTELDAEAAARAFGAGRFHIAAFDMPYGVQHGPGKREPFDRLLARALPALHASLMRGGAVALSFNTYTLPAKTVRALLGQAGFAVCEGGPYEGLTHWVEQAIMRDVAVGVKT